MARMENKILCILMISMMVVAPYAEISSCNQVTSDLVPCIGYLSSGGDVPAGCCSGVNTLNEAAQSTADRQTVCGCLKSAFESNLGIDPNNAASLPSKCGVNIPYEISPNTDCSTVQ